jgi:hypothetical protein
VRDIDYLTVFERPAAMPISAADIDPSLIERPFSTELRRRLHRFLGVTLQLREE